MIRGVLGSRASIGGVLGSGRGGAAAAWYLAGGVSAANCVVAYQPIGAASLAASYTNLANPGTYNAAPGVAPTFDTATGWGFAATNSRYLTTGITGVTVSWSMIVRFSSVSIFGCLCGLYKYTATTGGFAIFPVISGKVYYYGSGELQVAPALTSGVLAISGGTAYRNGSAETGSMSSTGATLTSIPIYIGVNANQIPAPTAGNYLTGSIQALAIYNTTLDAATVAAISAAMAAL